MKLLTSSIIALLGTASMAPAAIILANPSFETDALGDGAFQAGASDWPGGTTYLVDNGPSQNVYFAGAVPQGQQAMSLANGYITQQLNDSVNGPVMTTTLAQQFNISFYAARRLGASATGDGTFSVILQAYNGSTFVGNLASQKFCNATDGDINTIDLGLAAGQWSNQINLSLTAPANLFSGNNIRVVFAANTPFGNGGGNLETAIDNVSVTAVPEPAVALLGGLGLLALLRRRRC